MKKYTHIIILIVLFIIFLLILAIAYPSFLYTSQKKLFSKITPVKFMEYNDLSYHARYNLSAEDWQNIRSQLDGYEEFSIEGDFRNFAKPLHINQFFSDEEIQHFTSVYYLNEYKGILFFKKWSETFVAICPVGDSVSVYFSVTVHSEKIK